jgi:hypothetical protein
VSTETLTLGKKQLCSFVGHGPYIVCGSDRRLCDELQRTDYDILTFGLVQAPQNEFLRLFDELSICID